MTEKASAQVKRQRVRASEARTLAAGGVRIGMVLPPETAAALDALVKSGYATNRAAAMRRAIQDAHGAMQSCKNPARPT